VNRSDCRWRDQQRRISLKTNAEFLHARGSEIVNGRGDVVQVPFNYRHLETADRPFEHRPEEFAILDKVVGWACAQRIGEHTRIVAADLPEGWMNLDETLRFAICDGVLSRMLLPAFAGQFREMNKDEIDQTMQSFALRNCVQRDGLVRLIRARLLGRTRR
jgi:hypothetical protein